VFQQPAASGQQPIRVVVARFLASYELFQALKSSAPGSFVNARASSPRGLEFVALALDVSFTPPA
jgi:hypothetical protein